MSNPDLAARGKFQNLLRDLFQIRDAAELDFGIYRIMGQKRTVIEEFIDRELLAEIDAALKTGPLRQESQAAIQLAELAAQIRKTLADDAIDADGRLNPAYEKTKLGKDYLAVQQRTLGAKSATEHEASIYNHLYQFFSRYYDKGDFLSLRRYSKREKYAIPYNGEEVYLHWANADQYYVKTGETFTDYRWKDPSGAVRVRFTVTRADVPKDNIKSPDTRYFLPRLDEVTVETVGSGPKDPERHLLLTLPFHYRGLTEAEAKHLEKIAADRGLTGGNGSGGKLQAAALAEAVDYFGVRRPDAALGSGGPTPRGGNPEGSASNRETKSPRGSGVDPANNSGVEPPHSTVLAALLAEHHRDAEGAPISRLAHHLRRFTVKNTSDYFIHKDLGGFLTRELDFYLKNEVLHLDTLEAGGEDRAEGWFETLRVMRRIGGTIIRFLAQIENFQKRIFEKKKFVTECHWCLTLDRVPEELYPEIAKNAAQIAEWKKLFAIEEVKGWSEPPTVKFLKENWNLVLDTRFFGEGFVDALFNRIDLATVSTLVRSENWQALQLAQERYRATVGFCYNDPPYNTGKDDFSYKDGYQHSTWISMVRDRHENAKSLIAGDGTVITSINDTEMPNLQNCLGSVYGTENFVATVVWKGATDNNPTRVAVEHEYLICYAKSKEDLEPHWATGDHELKQEILDRFEQLRDTKQSTKKIEELFSQYMSENRERFGDLYRYRRVDEIGPYAARRNMDNPGKPGHTYDVIHPQSKLPCARPAWGWRFTESTMEKFRSEGRLIFGPDETKIPELKVYLNDVRFPLRSVISLDSRKGSNNLDRLFGTRDAFKNPKPKELVSTFASQIPTSGKVVLDFFAGSGTVAESVIDLNRSKSEDREFFLIEFSEPLSFIRIGCNELRKKWRRLLE